MNERPARATLLLTVTAVLEAGTGLALMTTPSVVSTVLLGASLDPPVALVVARIAGAALVALGVACWLARTEAQGLAGKGLIAAMVLYNAVVAAVLVLAGLHGIAFWPVVLLHVILAVWCITSLGTKQSS